MVEAAALALDYPEVAVVEEETLAMQTLAVASDLPDAPARARRLLLLARRRRRGSRRAARALGVLWLDAHGDLNTPESSPSGNEWGMPLRMLLDRGTVAAADVVLWGARNLDPPEEEYIAATGIDDDPAALLDRAEAVYVALDCDVLDPASWRSSCPSPAGRRSTRSSGCSREVRESGKLVGVGFTGLAPDPANVEKLERLAAALGY